MRIEQLTFTRFIAAISVVVFHYGLEVFPFNHESVNFLFRQANTAVSYFFVLSGFVMIIAYSNREKINFWSFFAKRFARIYPAYILAILLLLFYFIVQEQYFDEKALKLNISLLQSWVPGYATSFNEPGWSLSVEMFFYLCFPFLFNYLYSRVSLGHLVIPIFSFFVVSQVLLMALKHSNFYTPYPSEHYDLIFFFPLMHLNEFLIGNLAGIFFLRDVKTRNYDIPIILLVILTFVFFDKNIGFNLHNGFLAFFIVPFVILMSANNGLLTQIFSSKNLVFLGEISFGIYIFQKPIYIWTNEALFSLGIVDPMVIFYTSLLVLILFSAISYRVFETPIRKIIKQRLS